MHDHDKIAQGAEPLSAQVGVRLTPREANALDLVAVFDGVTKGEVIRRLLPPIVERAEQIRRRVPEIVERAEQIRERAASAT